MTQETTIEANEMVQTTKSNKPIKRVFVSHKRNGEWKSGSQIGVVFAHKNGDGENMVLDALPAFIDGKIQLTLFPID